MQSSWNSRSSGREGNQSPKAPAIRDSEGDDAGFTTVDVVLKRDHELSWGVMIQGKQLNEDMIWLPKSLVALTGGEQPACKARVRMPCWLAEKKGLA